LGLSQPDLRRCPSKYEKRSRGSRILGGWRGVAQGNFLSKEKSFGAGGVSKGGNGKGETDHVGDGHTSGNLVSHCISSHLKRPHLQKIKRLKGEDL